MQDRTAVVRIRYPQSQRKATNPKWMRTKGIIWEHIKYCCSISSMHGFNHIIWPKRSLMERLLWVSMVVGLSIFGISQGSQIFQRFYDRPCVISVEMDYKKWLNEFPSFTLCQTELDNYTLLERNIPVGSEMYKYFSDLAFGDYNNYHTYESYANGSKKEFLKPEQYLDTLLEVVDTLKNRSNVKTKNYFFPLNQVRPIATVATEHGICSTLNPSNGIYYSPGYHNSSKKYDYRPIYYDYQFTMLKAEVRGFLRKYKVALHSPHEVIDIGTKMYNFLAVSSAVLTVTSVSVEAPESVTRLSFRQRKCKLFTETEDLTHSPAYTYNLCRMECRIKLCLKYCQCTPYYYRRNKGEKICNMTGMFCLSKYSYELLNLYDKAKNKRLCRCYQNCNIDIPEIEDIVSTPWFNDTRLAIQLLDHPNIRFVRKLIFSQLDLLVQIGGILGLCLGATMLGLIEIVYFMTIRFYWAVIKGRTIKSEL